MHVHKCSHDHHHHDHDHTHDHGHSHGHGHHHHHIPKDFGPSFALAAALNMLFVGAELVFGFITQSLALLADAVHNFSDVVGLLLAWGAVWLARRPPTEHHTYGYRGASFLAALTNACLLFLVTGAIIVEALQRFSAPAAIASNTVMAVALVGIAVNGTTAFLFWRGQKDDINIRGAFLHMMADAAISFGVVVSALLIRFTGFLWLDPVVSLLIAAIIIYSSWGLATEALNMSLAAVPRHIDTKKVMEYLSKLPGVTGLHDLHIWAMSTTETALTAHLVRPGGAGGDDGFLNGVADDLHKQFRIQHATIQVETGDATHICRLASHSLAK